MSRDRLTPALLESIRHKVIQQLVYRDDALWLLDEIDALRAELETARLITDCVDEGGCVHGSRCDCFFWVDSIAKLRAEKDHAIKLLSDTAFRAGKLEAENERLRAALELIADGEGDPDRVARAALEAKP